MNKPPLRWLVAKFIASCYVAACLLAAGKYVLDLAFPGGIVINQEDVAQFIYDSADDVILIAGIFVFCVAGVFLLIPWSEWQASPQEAEQQKDEAHDA